ncbi:MAG: hypothetical protein LBR10_05530, partial [Prevotellaceae bacterium]|nr:hypothetical protein [Prevotellaceae bacterium]
NNPDFNQLKGFWLDFEEKVDSTKLTKPDSNKKQTLITKPTLKTAPKKTEPKKVKEDTVTRQHFIMKGMTIKYNFEESDSTKLTTDDFIGPPPEESNIL